MRDRSSETSLLAVQGPKAAQALERAGGGSLTELARFACKRADVDGIPVFAARTGYTGEDGFELFVSNHDAAALWRRLLDRAGDDIGLEPIGLGARDTLRLEAGLPLYGHELSRTITPLEAGLGWAVKLAKGDFIGARPLAEMRERGVPRRMVGLRLTEPGIARADYPVLSGERRVGIVTSGTKSPTLGDSIALALIEREWVDASLSVEIRGRRAAAERTALPFYQGSAKQRSDGR